MIVKAKNTMGHDKGYKYMGRAIHEWPRQLLKA